MVSGPAALMGRVAALRLRRAGRLAGAALGVGFVLAACGGPSPGAPGAPPTAPPTAGPSPAPVTASFLHVRQADAVATYRIDGVSGRLDLVSRQDLADVQELVGDPSGRFVYAAYGPDATGDPAIVVYAAQADGALALLSEAGSRPDIGPFSFGNGWKWLAASPGRVYALWTTRRGGGGQHSSDAYVTHAVTADGQLGPPYVRQFLWDDPGHVTLDPGADVLYKAAPPWWVDSTDREGVTAHAVEPDGRLRQTGWSDRCGDSQVGEVVPLLAVRGRVFGSEHAGQDYQVCSWETIRLAPRGSLGDVGKAAAGWTPTDQASPGLLAFAKTVLGPRPSYAFVRTDLRLLSLGPAADPELLDLEVFPAYPRQLLFHPSGGFLYVSGGDGRLRTYAIGPQSGLEMVEDLPGAGGAGPSTAFTSLALSMAVSVRPSTPRL